MKKIIAYLLILCLLLTGCTKSYLIGVGRDYPENIDEGIDGAPPYLDTYEVYRDMPILSYEQYVFFEIDSDTSEEFIKPQVYRASLTEDRQPTLFFNGQLIGIFKNTMIVCDDEAYYAVRLDQKNEWKKLAPAAYTSATVLLEDTLLIFGFKKFIKDIYYKGRDRFLDRIDLSTLEWTREDNDAVIIDALTADGLLYYLRFGKEEAYASDGTPYYREKIYFCVADPADKKETVLSDANQALSLQKDGDKIVSDQRGKTGFSYDTKTKTFGKREEDRYYFDGGFYTEDETNSPWSEIYHFRLQDGTEYTADLTYHGAGNIVTANSFGAAFIDDSHVCIIDWETKNIRHYYPEDFVK